MLIINQLGANGKVARSLQAEMREDPASPSGARECFSMLLRKQLAAANPLLPRLRCWFPKAAFLYEYSHKKRAVQRATTAPFRALARTLVISN